MKRVCALLTQVSKEFSVLPPMFLNTMTMEDRALEDQVMGAMFDSTDVTTMGLHVSSATV